MFIKKTTFVVQTFHRESIKLEIPYLSICILLHPILLSCDTVKALSLFRCTGYKYLPCLSIAYLVIERVVRMFLPKNRYKLASLTILRAHHDDIAEISLNIRATASDRSLRRGTRRTKESLVVERLHRCIHVPLPLILRISLWQPLRHPRPHRNSIDLKDRQRRRR